MNSNNDQKNKKCNCPFFKTFIKQLFDIGKSAGSLISEAIGIIRIFQRFTSAKSFSASFSRDYIKILNWASNLIQIITNGFIDSVGLTSFEQFYLYSCILPISLLLFISGLIIQDSFTGFVLFCFVIMAFGCGFGFININNKAAIAIIIVAGFFVISPTVYMFISFCKMRKQNNLNVSDNDDDHNAENEDFFINQNGLYFTKSFVGTMLYFVVITYLIIGLNNGDFAFFSFIVCILIFIIIFIIEILFSKCCCIKILSSNYDKYVIKLISMLISLFQLFIIPATENFVNIMMEEYKNKWQIIVCYIVCALIIPLLMTYSLIKMKYHDICDKYNDVKDGKINFYLYIELVDLVKQISFAIVSAYDIPWACIGIEIAWVIIIIGTRPYKNISDYSLSLGESLVMFIANGIALYAQYNTNYDFNMGATIVFVIIACLPSIISLYLFFIFDFDTGINTPPEQKINVENIVEVLSLVYILNPIALFSSSFILAIVFI